MSNCIFIFQPFSLQSVKLEAEFLSVRVACTDSVVFVVDKLDASLYARIGMTPSCPEGTAWTRIESAPKGIVSIRYELNETWQFISGSHLTNEGQIVPVYQNMSPDAIGKF